jgi:hypothetical protein
LEQLQAGTYNSSRENQFQKHSSTSVLLATPDDRKASKNLRRNSPTDDNDYASYAEAGVAALAGGMGLVLAGPEVAVVANHLLTYNPFLSTPSAEVSMKCKSVTLDEGTTKIELVQPDVFIDPTWDQIFRKGRSNAPMFWRKNRQFLEFDEGHLIPSKDQMMLMVSRGLKNRMSLSGFMYRYLLSAFHERYLERQQQQEKQQQSVVVASTVPTVLLRSTRDEAHAMVQYLVDSFLEEYPELNGSIALIVSA